MGKSPTAPRFAALSAALGIVLLIVAVWWLRHALAQYRLDDVFAHLKALGRRQLLAAGLLTGGSFFCLSLYELLGLRFAGVRVAYRRAAITAFLAYAIGQSVGVNALSGGAIRFRLYTAHGLSPGQIARLIGFGTVTFGLGAALLLGASLLAENGLAAVTLHWSRPIAIAAGVALLAVVGAYFAVCAMRRAPITLRTLQVELPTARVALLQIVIACADLLCAAGVLYSLLPSGPRLDFAAFAGLYLLSIVAGLVSSVPGGLGVFESVMILLLPQWPADRLLGAMIAYRCVYYLLPFAIAIAGLALHELWLHRAALRRAWRLSLTGASILAPQLAAMAVFLAGTVLIISGATPGLQTRLVRLEQWIPLPVLELSHLVGSAVGVGLLVLANGLYKRLDAAWWLTLWLLAFGISASLLKGFDYEEAMLLAAVSGFLVYARGRFDRRASLFDQRFSVPWILAILLVFGVAIWLVRFAYRHVPYAGDLWWQFAFQANAPRSLRALLAAAVCAAAYALSRLLRAAPTALAMPSDDDFAQAARIIELQGDSSANLALTGDKALLFSAERDAFLMFSVSGKSWVAMGDPVGSDAAKETLAWRYLELCDRAASWPVFYQVHPDNLALYVDLGLAMSKLGEEALVPLTDFSLDGAARADLRQSHRRAVRDGAQFTIIPRGEVAAHRADLQRISDDWLDKKSGAEKGFSVGFFDLNYLARCDCALVLREGRPEAFANLWLGGGRSELSVDLMRYSEHAPKGVMDFLFAECMAWGRAQGFSWFNLGMAPLAGLEMHPLAPAWHKLGRLIYRYGENFYNFEGLRKYKEKFWPEWRPRYLAAPGGLTLPRVLFDVTALISGGPTGIVHK
jgi:phosphatidylglycerol lysyltransferase